MPFLIRYPRAIRAGSRSGLLLGAPDILPTLLGLMGVKAPSGIEGANLAPLLRGQPISQPRSALLLCPCASVSYGQVWTSLALAGRGLPAGFLRPYRGVRTATHTYVKDRRGPWFLYDNEKDPYQLNNLIRTVGRRAIPAECERELAGWLDKTGDFFGDDEAYSAHVDLRTGAVIRPEALRRS